MSDITVTCEGIAKLLLNLNPNKEAGPDEIKPRVLKELATEIAPILTIIFQISLESGVVPSDWKTAHVAPVYKKGPKYNPENYRPISLTCICCKLLEHIVVSNIMSHADKYNILYPFQHGFRKFRSCETQLIEFIDDVTRNLYVLESVDKAKYLGVTISEDLKWESHINNICGKLKPIRLLASCVAT
jgi:hypothetical protein